LNENLLNNLKNEFQESILLYIYHTDENILKNNWEDINQQLEQYKLNYYNSSKLQHYKLNRYCEALSSFKNLGNTFSIIGADISNHSDEELKTYKNQIKKFIETNKYHIGNRQDLIIITKNFESKDYEIKDFVMEVMTEDGYEYNVNSMFIGSSILDGLRKLFSLKRNINKIPNVNNRFQYFIIIGLVGLSKGIRLVKDDSNNELPDLEKDEIVSIHSLKEWKNLNKERSSNLKYLIDYIYYFYKRLYANSIEFEYLLDYIIN